MNKKSFISFHKIKLDDISKDIFLSLTVHIQTTPLNMMNSQALLLVFALFASGVASTSVNDLMVRSWFGKAAIAAADDSFHVQQEQLDDGECRVALRVLAYDDEIEDGETTVAAGVSTFRYPIYHPSIPKKQIGIYIGASQGSGGEDCVGTGAFNFDFNPDTDSFDSQLFVAVSCSGEVNSIIGGTGSYAFVKDGYEVITEGSSGATLSELYFTSETCGKDTTSWSRR